LENEDDMENEEGVLPPPSIMLAGQLEQVAGGVLLVQAVVDCTRFYRF